MAPLVQPSPNIVVWVGGKPYVQPVGEFKAFYVSETTLQNPAMPAIDLHRYLDARHTQYIVLPGGMAPEAKIGDLAVVYDPMAKTVAAAVFGDIGPMSESREAALATLQRLGMAAIDGKSLPRQLRDDLFFLVFPKTAQRLEQAELWPHAQSTIDALATDEFSKWGGVDRIEAILNQDPHGGLFRTPQPTTWFTMSWRRSRNRDSCAFTTLRYLRDASLDLSAVCHVHPRSLWPPMLEFSLLSG